MVQIDVNKCFDSIYTHSLSWAVLGKEQTKANIDKSKPTFSGKFDSLMQRANYMETNGIVIGPEFSRVFAEIIMQSIDVNLDSYLNEKYNFIHKVDYEIFRYVDDYFVFYNKPSAQKDIIDALEICLKKMKLTINSSKIKNYEKPIITEITIAKERISLMLNEAIAFEISEVVSDDLTIPAVHKLSCYINANSLIIKFKAAIKESKVVYGDLLNYTFAIIENKLNNLFSTYLKSDKSSKDKLVFVNALIAILEFSFFCYSASPKVNHTIRISRIVTTITRFLNSAKLSFDHKHLVFKYIHDNILQLLSKNTMEVMREVESLYLLIVLSKTGKEYWLPETTLAKHFLIETDVATSKYVRTTPLSYFSITILLSYIKDKKRYNKIKLFIESHSILKLELEKSNCQFSAESFMLFLDLIICPYIGDNTKKTMGLIFGLDTNELSLLLNSNDHWFTAWGDKFDLAKELDMKLSREVY